MHKRRTTVTARMKRRTPTYLQYDEETVTDVSFSSGVESVTDKNPDVPEFIIPKSQPLVQRKKSFRHVVNLRKTISTIIESQRRILRNTSQATCLVPQYLRRKNLEIKGTVRRRKLENVLKASGSFRTRKGFVEVCNEESCLEQFDVSSEESCLEEYDDDLTQ